MAKTKAGRVKGDWKPVEAGRDTLGGALKALQNNFGDLMTAEGDSVQGLRGGIKSLNRTMPLEASDLKDRLVIGRQQGHKGLGLSVEWGLL